MSNRVTVPYSSLTHMILSANGFKHTFDTNYGEIIKNLINPPVVISDYDIFAATASNAFLSVELYFKFIDALFYWQQNEATKSTPQNSTQYNSGHKVFDLYIHIMSYPEVSTQLPNYVDNLTEVASFLDNNNNGFIEWRYFFENYATTETDFAILKRLLDGLKAYTHYLLDHKYSPKTGWTQSLPNLSGTVLSMPVATIEAAEKLLKTPLKDIIDS